MQKLERSPLTKPYLGLFPFLNYKTEWNIFKWQGLVIFKKTLNKLQPWDFIYKYYTSVYRDDKKEIEEKAKKLTD